MRFCASAKPRELMDNGVTIYKPETVLIDCGVTVGEDTVIEPFVQLLGETAIGQDCLIRSYSVLTNTRVGDQVRVNHGTLAEDSIIGQAAIVGPYSRIRPGSEIGPEAHVGNFVETKKVKLGRGAKANHLTYLGDAEIGERTNIGAGTITCNYDGVNKHRTVIGANAFIGSDSILVAPVSIGDGAYVAAASCITKDVPARRAGNRAAGAADQRGMGQPQARQAGGRQAEIVSGLWRRALNLPLGLAHGAQQQAQQDQRRGGLGLAERSGVEGHAPEQQPEDADDHHDGSHRAERRIVGDSGDVSFFACAPCRART